MYIVRIKDDVLRKSFGDKNSFIIVFSWFKLFKEIIVRILIINVDLMIFFGTKRWLESTWTFNKSVKDV